MKCECGSQFLQLYPGVTKCPTCLIIEICQKKKKNKNNEYCNICGSRIITLTKECYCQNYPYNTERGRTAIKAWRAWIKIPEYIWLIIPEEDRSNREPSR